MSIVNIDSELAVIDEGKYGKDVRQAMHNALEKLYFEDTPEFVIQSAEFTIPNGSAYVLVDTNSFDSSYPFFCWLSATGNNNYSAPLGFFNPSNANTAIWDLTGNTNNNRSVIAYALCYKNKAVTSTTTETTLYNSTSSGTVINETNRWFLNGTASGRIDKVSIKCKAAGGSVIVEGWELSNDTLTKVFEQTGYPSSANAFLDFNIGYESSNPVMVSVRPYSNAQVIHVTDTSSSFSAYRTLNLTSSSLALPSLITYPGLNVTGYITYTVSSYKKPPTYNCIYVSKDGYGNYTSINDAVQHADDGDTIVVFPGTYVEAVEAWGKELHIMGVDKNTCIITNSTGHYDTPAVEIDSGSLRNFTIISTGSAPTTDSSNADKYMKDYCVHVDHAHAEGRSLLIENCILRNNHRTAFGMGGYANNTVTIRNCDVWAGSPPSDIANPNWNKRGVLYFHNRQNSQYFPNVTGQKMRFISNTFYCEDVIALYILDTWDSSYSALGYTNEMEVEFINNMFVAKRNGVYETSSNGISTPPNYNEESIISGTGFTDHIKLSPVSYGNNLSYLNYSN